MACSHRPSTRTACERATPNQAQALAQYADEHGTQFERIIAVGIEKDSALYGINLKDPKVRNAVYQSPVDKDSLETLHEKHGTKYTTIPTGA